MEIQFKYSNKTEANRIYLCLRGILEDFYLRHNWYVLPRLRSYTHADPIIVLPRLDYQSLPLAKLKNDYTTMQINDPTIINNLTHQLTQLPGYAPIPDEILIQMRGKITPVLERTITQAQATIDYLRHKELWINVFPSQFGSLGSYTNFDINDDPIALDLAIRVDTPTDVIAELLISSVVTSKYRPEGWQWREYEAVSDYLAKHIFGLDDYIGTLRITQQPHPHLLKESIEYLHSLKLPTGQLIWQNENQQIFLINENLSKQLSRYENRLLQLLLDHPGETVTIDEIANGLYKRNIDERFSMWGINKTIQRLRNKLEKLGLPRSYIQNVRGEGYRLSIPHL